MISKQRWIPYAPSRRKIDTHPTDAIDDGERCLGRTLVKFDLRLILQENTWKSLQLSSFLVCLAADRNTMSGLFDLIHEVGPHVAALKTT